MYLYQWITVFAIAVMAALMLIPVVMVARVVLAVVRDARRERAADARKVVHTVPGLGEFSSTDGELWFGEVQSLRVSLISKGQPPGEAQAAQVRSIIADMPRMVARGGTYLASDEECNRLCKDAERFEAIAIHMEEGGAVVLELMHPDDADGVYRVEVREGEPVGWTRDD